jgi:hypothetical protein
MVLNDGETFTNLEGCKIIEVPENFDEGDTSFPEATTIMEFTELDNGRKWGMDYTAPPSGGEGKCRDDDRDFEPFE